MKNTKLKDIITASLLSALSATISLFFAYAIPSGGAFGLPLYAIPLVIASVTLGPSLGFIVAFLADLAIGFLGPYGYMPLYAFSTIVWGVIPGLILRSNKKYSFLKLFIAVFISYIMATLFNSFANYIYWSKKTFIATLGIRAFNLIVFTPIIAWITNDLITSIYVKDTKYLCGFKLNVVEYEKS